VIENTHGDACHSVPKATPMNPPMKAVSDEIKFMVNACLMLRPEFKRTAKSPVKKKLKYTYIYNNENKNCLLQLKFPNNRLIVFTGKAGIPAQKAILSKCVSYKCFTTSGLSKEKKA